MSACEKCWRDASERALLLGGSVSDHYRALLDERRDNPCPPTADEGKVIDARILKAEGSQSTGSATDRDLKTSVVREGL